MNREELRSQAAGRRNQVDAESSRRATWRCNFCTHDFVSETMFMRHHCKEKVKHEQLRSPLGQAAYAHYSHWMKCQKHSVPGLESFSNSKFYSTFIKFAEHANKVHIPNVKRFIEVMVENGKVPPALWCRDSVYSVYLKTYDLSVPPEVQFTESLTVLEDLANESKVELGKVFETVDIDLIENLIKKRKLSFWLLMASAKFRTWMLSRSTEEKERLQAALNSGAVLERLNQEADLFRQFVAATKEVGL